MSLHRKNPRRDTAEADVFATLRACGWTIEPHSGTGAPDAIIGKHGLNLWIECKTGKRKLNPDQVKWHAAWNGSKPYVLRNADDALALNAAASSLKKISRA